VDTAAS